MATAYTGNSIVDYLSSTGQDSSYGNRGKIYASSGLNMGSYAGTAQQNTALLNYLRGSGTPTASAPSSPAPAPSPTPTASPTPRLDFVNNQTAQLQTQSAAAKAPMDAARQKLIDFYASLESPEARYKKLREENGVAAQEALVNALTKDTMKQQDLLDAIEPSVNQRSGDFFINEADRTALVARESDPVLKSLNTLLRNKQYEEIGLAGKQQLVKDLLNLSLQGDEQRAKPLVLGVDYSTEDYKTAMDLLTSVTGQRISAFNADQSTAEDQAFQREMERLSQKNKIELENLQTSNSLKLKGANKAEQAADDKTETAWNQLLGSATTEYDVFKQLDQKQDELRKAGIDVDKLWQKHAALAAETGVGGAIRKTNNNSSSLTAEALLAALGE